MFTSPRIVLMLVTAGECNVAREIVYVCVCVSYLSEGWAFLRNESNKRLLVNAKLANIRRWNVQYSSQIGGKILVDFEYLTGVGEELSFQSHRYLRLNPSEMG